MKVWGTACCTCALIMLLMLTPGEAGLFNALDIRVEGIVKEIIADDLNGDGLKDILVIHTTGFYPNEQRWLSIFLQDGNGRFREKPDQTLPAPEDAVLVDPADVLDEPGKEIVFITGDGATCLVLRNGEYEGPKRLIRRQTLTAFPDTGNLPHYDFARDWNGDGSEEIALFLPGAVEFYDLDEGDARRTGSIALDIKASLRARDRATDLFENFSIRIGYRLPELLTADYDRDGKLDLWAIQGDTIHIYAQKEDGNFSVDPARTIRLNLLTDDDKRKGDATLIIRLKDLDGDGLVDLAASKMKGRVSDLTAHTAIYLGRDRALESGQPSQVITSENVTGTALIDANNDGRLDLVMASTGSNILSYVKVLLTRGVTFSFMIYQMGEDGRYSETPDYIRTNNFNLDLEEGALLGMLPRYGGDFDGNGSRDIVFATSDHYLSFVLTSSGREFPENPQHIESVNVSNRMLVSDLNGDGKSEIIFYYGTKPKTEGLVKVLLNSGRWDGLASSRPYKPEDYEMGRTGK